MLKRTQLFAVIALIAAFVGTAVAADDAKLLREANDRAEIQALMWRYTRAIDTLDVEAYVSVFSENAQFGTAKGRDGIRALITGIKAAREKNTPPGKAVTQSFQTMSNMTIEFLSEDRARLQAYYALILAGDGTTPARVATAGREIDELVRVNGQWLIDNRNVSP